ncbi:molybdate transport system ATP-binding protein [Rhodobacter sp. JA431]|uniref:molybdenum ABC transporter ATP-binding protein n=1 Tax=Rhodobacter sp. JA431 TaxID=570013 RepID=UPI000BDB1CCB|nr:molybdenum ABC transporter ATP-binding protein [Rhodobacter sp. JA431]SOC12418.1 molybdate transport system ATP-binding protein [Rhodobacter sp. JA431]
MIHASFKGRIGGFVLDAEFEALGHGVTALFGPSGCGKTTVLRCMAGLTRLTDGQLTVGGKTWQAGRKFTPIHRRAVGYVFQEASLFAHLSVRDNLCYGLKRAKGPQRIGEEEVVSLLGIAPLFERPTPTLSGGERQRVAIGRALLSQPELLLMDEPLSALDRLSREEILPYLERLHARLEMPVILVSHDMTEVERLADRLVLMERGRVRAEGPLAPMLADPDLPLIHRPDLASVLEGEVVAVDDAYGLSQIAVPGGVIVVPGRLGPAGARRRMRIPAADVSLGRNPPSDTTILNALPATILSAEPEPNGSPLITVRLMLGRETGGALLLARISRKSWDSLGFAPGEPIVARLKATSLSHPSTSMETAPDWQEDDDVRD